MYIVFVRGGGCVYICTMAAERKTRMFFRRVQTRTAGSTANPAVNHNNTGMCTTPLLS